MVTYRLDDGLKNQTEPRDQTEPGNQTEPKEKKMAEKEKKSLIIKMLPLAVLALGLVAFIAADGSSYFNFQTLSDNRAALTGYVQHHAWTAAGIFTLLYAVSVAFSFPGATILTLTGGFLFGVVIGSILTVSGATVGAILLFLAARMSIGETLRRRAGPFLKKIEKGFHRNAASYMLTLRLVPVFPFWLVNLAPALFGVRLSTFSWTTLVGIIPGTVVFVSVGNGLGAIFDHGETPDLGIIFEPSILLPLIGLSVLSLIPVVYDRLKSSDRSHPPATDETRSQP